MVNRNDLKNLDESDTFDIPDFVEDKTTTESSVDMSIFKMSDDELYDDNTDENEQTDYDDDDDERPARRRKSSSSTLIICLILIAVLLATTIGALIYGVKQHNQYVKVNTENVELRANENSYKEELAKKDAEIASLREQINNQPKPSGGGSSSQGNLAYTIVDGPLHFRVSPTTDAEETTYNGASLANDGEVYNVIEVVKDVDLGDQLKWAKLADRIYFLIEDNGNVYAKPQN